MSVPWSDKNEKTPPLVSSDQFMILDSQEGDPSNQNKRVLLSTVQANLVTNVDANSFSITDVGTILSGLESSNNILDSFELRLQRQRATDPEDVVLGDSLGKITFFGADTAAPAFSEGGRLEFFATENWNSFSHAAKLQISTTEDDTPVVRLIIEEDGTANFQTNTISNVVDPTNPQDAATKLYVDGIALGLNWRESVRLATTTSDGNISLTGVISIDSSNSATGDRILVKNQSASVNNGIYIANDGGAWARSSDMAASSDAVGAAMFVSEGTENDSDSFVQNQSPATVDTNDLIFVQITGLKETSLNDLTDVTITGTTVRDLLVSDNEGDWINRQGVFPGITGLGIQSQDLSMNTKGIVGVTVVRFDTFINTLQWGTGLTSDAIGFPNSKFTIVIDAINTEYEFGAIEADFKGNDIVNVGNLTFNGIFTGVPNIPAFSDSRDYVIGDVVIEDSITYRAITAITAGAFVQTDWRVSDGVGVKNLIQVYTETDFGTPAGGEILLTDETEYLISAEIDLNNTLKIPNAGIVTFRSLNKEKNKVEMGTDAIDILISININGNYSSVTNEGGNTRRFNLTSPETGLAVDDLVNIEGTAYVLNRQVITGVDGAGNWFEIDSSIDVNETGSFNTYAVKVEMQDMEFEGVSGGINNGVNLLFTLAGSSEWFANHCDFEHLVVPINIDRTMLAITHLCEFEDAGTQIYGENNENIIHTANSYFEPVVASDVYNVEFSGTTTESVNAIIANNSFESTASTNAIHIFEPNEFPDTTRFVVTGNLDKNPNSTSLFETTDFGQDETDNQVIASANAKQKDSRAFTENFIQAASTAGPDRLTVLIVTEDVYADIVDITSNNALWSNRIEERFALSNASNGEVTYTGLEEVTVSISYSAVHKTFAANLFSALAVFLDTGGGFTLVPNSEAFAQTSGATSFVTTSRNIEIALSTGDKLKLRVKNIDGTQNMNFLSYTYTVSA